MCIAHRLSFIACQDQQPQEWRQRRAHQVNYARPLGVLAQGVQEPLPNLGRDNGRRPPRGGARRLPHVSRSCCAGDNLPQWIREALVSTGIVVTVSLSSSKQMHGITCSLICMVMAKTQKKKSWMT